jgi:hypothetical protein
MQENYSRFGSRYEKVTFDNIAASGVNGYTSSVIDPVTGANDPKITVYSGAFDSVPSGWSNEAYQDPNNSSIVIKVTFGNASFLFSGDLELKGIKRVLEHYRGTSSLKADVLQIGHHGAKNAITEPWFSAIQPKYAIISCGQWNYGMLAGGKPKTFTTYAYAHPNKVAIDLLESKLPTRRPAPITKKIGVTGSYKGSIPVFTDATISKVYATPWDGNIVVKATSAGSYQIATKQ